MVKLARHSLWQAAVFGEFGVSLLLEAYNLELCHIHCDAGTVSRDVRMFQI